MERGEAAFFVMTLFLHTAGGGGKKILPPQKRDAEEIPSAKSL
jgi:hypothetical protein